MTRSLADASRSLKQAFPPGDETLYAWGDAFPESGPQPSDSWVTRDLRSKAHVVKAEQEAADQLRTEQNPATAVEKLPDWEGPLGIDRTLVALQGSTAQRQAQVVARLRERGTPTRTGVAAAAGAICGYKPEIVEHSRATLTALHTHAFPGGPFAIAATTGLAQTAPVFIGDNSFCSKAGGRLVYTNLSHASPWDLTVRVRRSGILVASAPVATWGAGAFVGVAGMVYLPQLAEYTITGNWTVAIENAGANAGSVDTLSLFVEGIGRAANGAEGLGARIFEWSVVVNEAICGSTYDRGALVAAVDRWNPAGYLGGVALMQTDGDLGAMCDDDNCIADLCVGD